jgi:hypothetical protein
LCIAACVCHAEKEFAKNGATSLSLRWRRAQHIDRNTITPLGHGSTIASLSLESTGYAVQAEDNAGSERPEPLGQT